MKKEFIFRFVLAMGIFLLVFQFGVKPLFKSGTEHRPKASPGWLKGFSPAGGASYDVIVFGEEPEGIAAAVSSARLGARTLLLAEGKDLGGSISRCLLSELELPYGQGGAALNGGILNELDSSLGKQFSAGRYISAVDKLVSEEKNIDVKYDVSLDSVVRLSSNLEGLKIKSEGMASTVRGRFFIDATRDGTLLAACKVPFITGSGDLGMPESYAPAMLNFEMAGGDSSKIRQLVQDNKSTFYSALAGYQPVNPDTRLDTLRVLFPEKGKLVIQGLEVSHLDVADRAKVQAAYARAGKEAENLALFLSARLVQFKDWKFLKAADGLYIRETRHFAGLYALSVNDILDNRFFDDTVAMGSYPITMDKFAERGAYTAGKPVQYGIPLDCLVPRGAGNLLMVGAKASYASLASTSAGTLGTGAAEGEAAGVTAVYCLAGDVTPEYIVRDKNRTMMKDIRDYLAASGFYLPRTEIPDRNVSNWSYPAARELLELGLIAGGEANDLRFDTSASQKDLAIILLNGVYRVDKDRYSLDLDSRLRPYFKSIGPLTRDSASGILLSLFGADTGGSDAYKLACDQGYINDVMKLRLKNKKVLTMDDVYYLGAYNIKLFTKHP